MRVCRRIVRGVDGVEPRAQSCGSLRDLVHVGSVDDGELGGEDLLPEMSIGRCERLQPGDILVTNDSYVTGSHLNHFTFTLPIFHGGKLAGFACCMGHWRDVGGVLGAVTTDIYSEGLQIPILKYQDRGVVNQDLVNIIRMNVRIPERGIGDLRAQVTAVKTGERRFMELLSRYGRAQVLSAIRNIMDQSEAAAR